MKYDVIVLGAGASGSVIAARVSEDPRRSVLLLEAGLYYPSRDDMTPDLLNGNDNAYAPHNWEYMAEANTVGRVAPLPAGKVVGGSSAINTAIALRGVPEDYDEWAALGNSDWSWAHVLPYFKRLESDRDIVNEYHGSSGPIPIRRYRDHQLAPVQSAFMQAMRDLGHPETPDNNDPQSTGLGFHPMNKDGSTRMSVAICYLEPARHRLNLTVRGGCHVRRIVFEGCRVGEHALEEGTRCLMIRAAFKPEKLDFHGRTVLTVHFNARRSPADAGIGGRQVTRAKRQARELVLRALTSCGVTRRLPGDLQ